MAAPTYGVAGTALGPGTAVNSAVPIPGTTANNTIVYVELYMEAEITVTPPAGFTEVTPYPETTGTVTVHRKWWKRCTGSDGAGTYTFTHASAFREGIAYTVLGAKTTGDPHETPVANASRSSNGTTTPAVSHTTVGEDRLLVWSASSVGAGDFTPPTAGGTWTERVDLTELTVATKSQAAIGSTGSVTGGAPNGFHNAWLTAVIPAGVTVNATMVANLGGLTATIAGQPKVIRRNRNTNPSCKTVATGWFGPGGARVTGQTGFRAPSATGFRGNAAGNYALPKIAVTAGEVLRFSVEGKGDGGGSTGLCNIDYYNGAGGSTFVSSSPAAAWSVADGVVSLIDSGSDTVPATITHALLAVNGADAPLILASGLYSTAAEFDVYFDGDSPQASWDGADGNSSSTYSGNRTFGTLAASLGGLTATISGTTAVPPAANMTAALGGLSATILGTRTTFATMVANLGGLSATAVGVRTVPGTMVAQLGGLTATIAGAAVTGLGGSGAALNPSVWAVDRDTLAITGPLPLWESLTLSPVANSPGACEVVYPAGAEGFALLDANVDALANLDQEVEVWLSGDRDSRTRWILQQKAGDRLVPGELWRFTGTGLEQLLDEVLVGPQATETKELIFSSPVTYGSVLNTVVTAAKARSASILADLTLGFTNTHDSNGVAWSSTVVDLKFTPTDTLLDVAQIGPELAIGEFEVDADRVLQAYNPGTRGTDRTLGAVPLRLAHGANLSEASHRESSRAGDSATAVLAKGAEGVYQWAVDTTAQTARARRVEASTDAGKLTSTGAVAAVATTTLAALKLGQLERVHGVEFGARSPIPLVDFHVGDWVLSQVGTTLTRQRIVQWTATFAAGGPAAGTVRTNDLIADRLTRLLAQLDRVRRGDAVVGTSTPSAEVDDGKAPAQVTGVVAESSGHAYTDRDGATWAAVLVDWAAVTTNADATPADDIVGYIPQFRYTAGAPLPAGWQTLPQVSATETDFDGVVADQPIEVRVAAIDRWGRVGAFSSAAALTSGEDTTAPPTPSTPVASNYLGILRVDWDGLGSVGQAQPADFQHVEVHVSESSGFTPDADPYPAGTRIGVLRGAGSFPWAPPTLVGGAGYGDTWFTKLVAVDRNANRSAASAQDSAVTGQVEEGDVASVNIGVLTAGILNALLIVGDTIATSTTGSRVELSDTGLFAINSADDVVLSYNISTEDMTMVGRLIAGEGVGVGETIVVDPDVQPQIRWYPSATAAHLLQVAFTTTTADGDAATPVWLGQMQNTSGDPDGGFHEMWADGNVLGHLDTAGDVIGGRISMYPTGLVSIRNQDLPDAVIQVQGDGDIFIQADDNGEIFIQADTSGITIFDTGNVQVGAPNNNFLSVTPSGSSLVSNGVVKALTIDHPSDPDRYLRHGCTEGPEGGLFYRGQARLDDRGRATVELPHYFEAITLTEHRTVHVTVLVDEDAIDDLDVAPAAVATLPRDGRFRVAAPGAAGMLVAWRVDARRADAADFDPEPLRADIEVRAMGPYTWEQRRPGQQGQAAQQPTRRRPDERDDPRRRPGQERPR